MSQITPRNYQIAKSPNCQVDQWRCAARSHKVDSSIRSLYRRFDLQVARHGAVCWVSGRCCRFDAYGHRLYVTGLEIAWFLQQVDLPQPQGPSDSCPYQHEGVCSVHSVRPLGCRIFYCQKGTERWQQDLYECYLDEVKVLHERMNISYRYMEWRVGLEEFSENGV